MRWCDCPKGIGRVKRNCSLHWWPGFNPHSWHSNGFSPLRFKAVGQYRTRRDEMALLSTNILRKKWILATPFMKVVPARGLVERCCDLVFYKNFSDKTTYLSYKPCHQISCLPMMEPNFWFRCQFEVLEWVLPRRNWLADTLNHLIMTILRKFKLLHGTSQLKFVCLDLKNQPLLNNGWHW